MRHVLLTLALAMSAGYLVPATSAQADSTAAPSGPRSVVQVGAGSPHAWNFIGLTREFSTGAFRPFATVGLGSFLVGGGVAYYTNPDGTGLVLSVAGGLAGAQATAALDFRLSQRAGLVLGGSYGNYFLQYEGPLPIASLQVRP